VISHVPSCTANTVIANAIPYQQMGIIKSLYYSLKPKHLTLDDFTSSLNSHLFCLGTSGSGKSRFITALATAEIEAGHSVLLIDTSQDPFRQVLYYCIQAGIPPERVIILDATQRHIPVPDFHIFEVHDDQFEDSIVDGFLAAQRGFLGDSFGERQADILRMLAYVFAKANAPFLPYSIQFLTDEKIRNAILKRANDKTLTQFWEHMTKQGSYNSVIESSRNKLNALAMNSLVSQYFDSNRSTVDLYQAFKDGKIILLNLSENHYKDRSLRALLGALFLFLSHQALLRRELDHDEDKTEVAIVLDEAHQYYISDFITPFYTGTRKHNVGIKIFSQSCNNFPPNDIDIILATASHLIAFGIGYRDAERIVKDLILPQDNVWIRDSQRDIYGTYGQPHYFGIGEQREHATAEITRQAQRKLFWRVRTANTIDLYLAETANQPKLAVPHDEEMAYRHESARHHSRMAVSNDETHTQKESRPIG
jgi:energy-coupling factor transporter ATP-binding protein EcfA2